jgi:outer membrane protein assembly factor BamB/predicted MPP superfamily phosphohydrolase
MRGTLGPLLLAAALLCTPLSSRAQKEKEKDRTAEPNTFTFLNITDTHQTADGTTEPLRALVTEATSGTQRPAFIIHTGDVTETGRQAEYDRFKQVLAPLNAAGIKFYAVPGHHDVRWSPDGKETFSHNFGKLYQSFDYSGAHFILLDTTVMLEHWGHLDKPEMDWLSKDIKRVRPETPVFLFMHHWIGRESPAQRMIDNENDLMPLLRDHNLVAIFTGHGHQDLVWQTNGVKTLMARGLYQGSYYKVIVSPQLVTIERYNKDKPGQGSVVATLPLGHKSKTSQMHVFWDDDNDPFLTRRWPTAVLQPRAISDNPEKESAQYRIDEGAYKPLIKDSRDIWRDPFPTKDIPVGVHTADVRLTTSNNVTYDDELIFEIERDNREPTRKWAVNLDGAIQSNPLLDRDTLYVSCMDSKLYAMDIAKGKHRWIFPTKGALLASPVLSGTTLYIASMDHGLYAIEPDTGHQRWRFEAASPLCSTPAVAQSVVCVGGNGKIYGVNAEDGKVKWTQPAGGFFQSHVTADQDTFYLGGWDNTFYALDAVTGTPRWTVKLGKTFYYSPAISTPALGNGRVYVCTNDGMLHALNVANGHEDWAVHAPQGSDAFGYSSPVVLGLSLYIAGLGDHGDVYALDTSNGKINWQSPTGQAIYDSSPKLSPDGTTLAIMGVRGHISILSTADGKRAWGYELGPGNIFSTAEYDGRILYTVTMAHDVQAINGPGIGGVPAAPAKTAEAR